MTTCRKGGGDLLEGFFFFGAVSFDFLPEDFEPEDEDGTIAGAGLLRPLFPFEGDAAGAVGAAFLAAGGVATVVVAADKWRGAVERAGLDVWKEEEEEEPYPGWVVANCMPPAIGIIMKLVLEERSSPSVLDWEYVGRRETGTEGYPPRT